ncbi:MAG: hypothetical protein FP814_10020 [Desulfobacterium sp.]|nr:hypothetical protein [Desulfobacterium sp.]MBU3950316.1 hypothetical protein [Pseudomonadota bacterium]MBU4035022.1 hypothetical protein [Pseudomonadota bacterium]
MIENAEKSMKGESNRSLEQIYRSAVSGLYSRLRSNYDFIYQKFGDDGLEIISEMSHQYGLDIAKRAKNRLDKRDLESITSFILRIFETMTWGRNDTGLTELTKTRAVIRADHCPLNFKDPKMCLAHTTMEKTVVEELNQDLKYSIGKSIPAGDGYCEHIIEVKSVKRT